MWSLLTIWHRIWYLFYHMINVLTLLYINLGYFSVLIIYTILFQSYLIFSALSILLCFFDDATLAAWYGIREKNNNKNHRSKFNLFSYAYAEIDFINLDDVHITTDDCSKEHIIDIVSPNLSNSNEHINQACCWFGVF